MGRTRWAGGATVLALTLAITACGGLGGLGGLGGSDGGVLNAPSGDRTATVDVEVRANDTRQQLLQVVTEDGREGVVRWDAGTRVVYRGETYSAAALERGDLVRMRLQETSDGALYTDYVEVTRSVQERSGHDRADGR